MELYSINEFENCQIYDNSPQNQIQIHNVSEDTVRQEYLNSHVICFAMEGAVSCSFTDKDRHEFRKGDMVFLPVGTAFSWTALEQSQILVFRLLNPGLRLCDSFPVERLFDVKRGEMEPHTGLHRDAWFSRLEIHPRLWPSLENTRDHVLDGVRCKRFFELEIEHFFLLLRFYYSKEMLYDFLHFIVTGNLVFTEYIRLRWQNYRTVKELADSMHLTPQYFTRKFQQFFGQKPYQWMTNNRARVIFGELTSTNKPLKQIAFDHGFRSFQQFATFTKKMLGKTPTEIRAGTGM